MLTYISCTSWSLHYYFRSTFTSQFSIFSHWLQLFWVLQFRCCEICHPYHIGETLTQPSDPDLNISPCMTASVWGRVRTCLCVVCVCAHPCFQLIISAYCLCEGYVIKSTYLRDSTTCFWLLLIHHLGHIDDKMGPSLIKSCVPMNSRPGFNKASELCLSVNRTTIENRFYIFTYEMSVCLYYLCMQYRAFLMCTNVDCWQCGMFLATTL